MSTDIALPTDRIAARRADQVSQQTAIEQARAVAEVAGQIRAAQDNPRSMQRAFQQMSEACDHLALAERAFYAVPNRGAGPSVHLARELARCFGNIQHGVVELHRDDAEGVSEVQAFAWDVENNTRSVRSFIVPHARMAGGSRRALTDLTDIVNNNNNAGARAVRETIWHVLPVGFRLEAEQRCQATLEKGNGEPLPVRIEQAVAGFARGGIELHQLEARIGRDQSTWDEADLAELAVLFQSLRTGDVTKAEAFPDVARPVTAEDLTGAPDQADVAANDPALEQGGDQG